MDLLVQIIAAHPVVAECLASLLAGSRRSGRLVLPPVTDLKQLPGPAEPRLFVIDALSLPLELSSLTRLLRIRYPGSKFVILVGSERGADIEVLRLLHRGIDGIVVYSDDLKERLPEALQAVLDGALWAPPRILFEYHRQIRLLLNFQILPNTSLTARETQILQLVIRRLSNSEIADALGIKERTVRFHIFNIFSKLRVEDRGDLQVALERSSQEPA